MVIVHLSDTQRRVITSGKDETVDQLCKRFCSEQRLSPLQFEFYSVSTNEPLPLNLVAHEIKEVRLCSKSINCKDSPSVVVKTNPERPKTVIQVTLQRTIEKTVKRKAPMPPESSKTSSSIDLSIDDSNIYIPRPPIDTLPTTDDSQSDLFVQSTESNTEESYKQVNIKCDLQEEPASASDSDISDHDHDDEDDEQCSKEIDDPHKYEEPMTVGCNNFEDKEQSLKVTVCESLSSYNESEKGDSSVQSEGEEVVRECRVIEVDDCESDDEGGVEEADSDIEGKLSCETTPEEHRMNHRREVCVWERVCTVVALRECVDHNVSASIEEPVARTVVAPRMSVVDREEISLMHEYRRPRAKSLFFTVA